MKFLNPFVIMVTVLVSCKTSKDYLSRINEDRTIFDAVKELGKRPGDSDAIRALPALYLQAESRHLKKINSYSSYNEISHWDKVIDEYTILQKMYEAILEIPAAKSLVNPVNYNNTLAGLKLQAAEDYYIQANSFLERPGRNDAKTAYNYFKKAGLFAPGYKDSRQKMNEAYQNAIVNVLINPVQDNSYFFNSGWGNSSNTYINEYFQQTLVRELGGKNASRYPARFYSDWEARRDNIQPGWIVDLTLRNMDFPRPYISTYSRNESKQLESGRDTSGRPVFQTVYATVNITKESFTARVEMAVEITEPATHKNISYKTFREEYSWQEEHANYSGDSRALSNEDWNVISNSNFNEPRKEDVLSELFRRIYPQVKNNISNAVDW